jgi:phage terminase large subunit GpA-like protein
VRLTDERLAEFHGTWEAKYGNNWDLDAAMCPTCHVIHPAEEAAPCDCADLTLTNYDQTVRAQRAVRALWESIGGPEMEMLEGYESWPELHKKVFHLWTWLDAKVD